jgi:DNA-binding ferritin-like protein
MTKTSSEAQTSLQGLLPLLRLEALVHQTNHWCTKGAQFFGDHQLYSQLYEEVNEMIDDLAEKLVGLMPDDSHLNPTRQLLHMLDRVKSVAGSTEVELSLAVVEMFLAENSSVYAQLDAQGLLTLGLDNLLQDLSDQHEKHKYLLSQRNKTYYIG